MYVFSLKRLLDVGGQPTSWCALWVLEQALAVGTLLLT